MSAINHYQGQEGIYAGVRFDLSRHLSHLRTQVFVPDHNTFHISGNYHALIVYNVMVLCISHTFEHMCIPRLWKLWIDLTNCVYLCAIDIC